MTSLSATEETLATALLAAQKQGKLADPKAMPAPADAASAMRTQAQVARQLGQKVVGWKVGFGPDGAPFAAPLLDNVVLKSPARWVQKPGPDFRIEIEFGVRLGKDLPPRSGKPYDAAEILAACDTVFCGIEMVASRYTDPAQPVFLLGLADFANNGGYILGQEKKTNIIPGPLDKMVCRATLDGKEVFDAAPKHPQNDILLPLVAYASRQNDDLGGLKAGHIITTGSLCGVLSLKSGGKFVASLTGWDDMVIELAHG